MSFFTANRLNADAARKRREQDEYERPVAVCSCGQKFYSNMSASRHHDAFPEHKAVDA
jgi:hypothetical protein